MPGKSGSSAGGSVGKGRSSAVKTVAAVGGVGGGTTVAANTPPGQEVVNTATEAVPSSAPTVTSPIPGVPLVALVAVSIALVSLAVYEEYSD